jgi:anti-sigma B factor antagonist
VVAPELKVVLDPASESSDSWPVLRVFGEVDIQTSPILDEELRRVVGEGVSSIIVDLSEVTFLDSTGLSVLIAGLKRCQNARGDLRLVSPRSNVRKVLEITGLIDVFHLQAPDEERA